MILDYYFSKKEGKPLASASVDAQSHSNDSWWLWLCNINISEQCFDEQAFLGNEQAS